MPDKDLFESPEGEPKNLKYHSKAERKIDEWLPDFDNFVSNLAFAGALLALTTFFALFMASVQPLSVIYQKVILYKFGFLFGQQLFAQDLKFWVNEVLLSVFFFFIGLEIKREILAGQLSNTKNLLTITAAAFGGMLFPALIYLSFNHGSETLKGWGIPLATDTAFALGIIFLFRKQFTKAGIVFITSIAIIDDIGAILVIAFAYTDTLDITSLIQAALVLSFMMFINYCGIRKILVYVALGIILWIYIHHSGIHATITGILVAFVAPSRPKKGPRELINSIRSSLNKLEKQDSEHILDEQGPQDTINSIQEIAAHSSSPLLMLWERLHFPIFFIILPLFAFVNAGLKIEINLFSSLMESPISLGIIFGLILGKPIGICLTTMLSQKFRLGNLPKELKWDEIFNLSIFAAIGFTMSLFISNLSFDVLSNSEISKGAIIFASFFASFTGIIVAIFRKRQLKKAL